MRKLRLDLDEIRVDSFRTSEESAWRGTVRGNGGPDGAEAEVDEEVAITPPPPPKTASPEYTCFDTCAATCQTRCTCPTYFGECGCV